MQVIFTPRPVKGSSHPPKVMEMVQRALGGGSCDTEAKRGNRKRPGTLQSAGNGKRVAVEMKSGGGQGRVTEGLEGMESGFYSEQWNNWKSVSMV